MTSSDSALPVATRNPTDTYTRITNLRRLRLIRVVWGVLMLLNLILFALGMVEYAAEIRRGCLCNAIEVRQQDGEIVLSPLEEGPAVGLIQEGEVLIAVDDTLLPPQASPDDATSLINSREAGTPITLTIRSSGDSTRDVRLTRVAFYGSLHGGMQLGLSLDGVIAYRVILYIFVFVCYVAVAIFIAWRRSDDWMALYAAWALLAFELIETPTLAMFLGAYPSLWTNLLFAALHVLVANVALLFPDGRFAPRWSPVAAVLFGLWNLWLFGRQAILWESAISFMFSLIFAGIIIYRYRYVFTPIRRQQTKWALFGIVTAILAIQGDGVLRGLIRAIVSYDTIAAFSFFTFPLVRVAALLIPVTMAVAVLRYRLWDIDLTLNRSLVYGSVTVVLGALFFVQFLIVQAVLSGILGSSQSGIAVAISAVATGALFNPARKRVQHLIDRHLYGFRFDLNELDAAQKTPEIKNPGRADRTYNWRI